MIAAFKNYLRTHGRNVSRPRVEIAKTLADGKPRTAAEVVLQTKTGVSMGAVRNTLELLVDAGLIYRSNIPGGPEKFRKL